MAKPSDDTHEDRSQESQHSPTLADLLDAVRDLQAENERLRLHIQMLEGEGSTPSSRVQDVSEATSGVELSAHSPADQKLALFQRLFRGRDDVYAARWESPDGRSGYAPALRYGAPRGRGIKHDPNDYVPLQPQVIRNHLTGTVAAGIYPLLQDETCWFVAIDFDKDGWESDACAVLDASDSLGVPAALERSRSGHGAHLWVFFSAPVTAALARDLGSAILTRAIDQRHQIGLDSYDRLFPSQDTLPTGGFGNLIALPLQGAARRDGNTVFVDQDLKAFPDQWRFLSSIQRLEPAEAESIVAEARRQARLFAVGHSWFDGDAESASHPWMLSPSRRTTETPIPRPLPLTVQSVLANRLFIETGDLPPILD